VAARRADTKGGSMRSLTSRFVLLIATAAVLPLVLYGFVSFRSLRAGTEESVGRGNLAVAQQISLRIGLYFNNNIRVLTSIGTELRNTQLEPWQQTRILRNHVLDFREFRHITLLDAGGRVLATSRVAQPDAGLADLPQSGSAEGFYVAPPYLDSDSLPTTTIAVPLGGGLQDPSWIVAEISLEELWRTVDSIHVGTEGYALLMDGTDTLIAHGNPNDKGLIASGAKASESEQQLAAKMREGRDAATARIRDARGRELLAVAAQVRRPDWTVIVEQPTSEAFAVYSELQRQLIIAIGVALLGTFVVGWFWTRSFIRRIFALTKVTRAIAEGRLDERVALSGNDEIMQLGTAFNTMTDRLVELQEDVRKQERQAMFGRIAAGLVHDLSHPIQNIGNSCKLIQKMFEDAEYRETFKRTVDRELVIIKRVLDDLRNIARPIPLERFVVDVNRTVAESVEAMQPPAETAGLTLQMELSDQPGYIEGDVFALGRVYRNLILNAIQATAPGGLIVVTTELSADHLQVRVYDTGCGIPPQRLGAIFEDFMTTKRRGLGLGLAISKKIVEQLGGTITVTSEVGKGTTFVLDFPRTRARPMLVAG
jgi:signal transduction histidine kinase